MNKPDFISAPDYEILKRKYPDNLDNIIKRIENGYPIQYLIGNVEFYNSTIDVNEYVLIPRFETENLVDKTIKYGKKMFNKKIDIIDLGTGSGCIAIALKKALDANVTGVDISADALEVAKSNALKNNVEINFLNKDMLDSLKEQYDIIISNPPYIPEDGFVQDIVKNNEPHLALFAPNKGLYFYEGIIKRHLCNLNKPGLIAFEIGDNQKEDLEKILKKYNLNNYTFENDLQGLVRYLFIFNE